MDSPTRTDRAIKPRFEARTWLGLLLTAIIFVETGCTIEDWPYYKVSAPGASVTRTSSLSRGNLGELLHFAIVDGAELTATSNCYPREENGFQHCSLIVTLEAQKPMNIEFTAGPFVARAPSEPEARFGSDGFRQSHPGCPPNVSQLWCTRERVVVQLDYTNVRPLVLRGSPPRQVELLVPPVVVDKQVVDVPAIRFTYEDAFPYQCVPLFVNF